MSDDRFVSPKPVFKPPTDPLAIEVLTHRPKDHTPSPNVVQEIRGMKVWRNWRKWWRASKRTLKRNIGESDGSN